VAERGVRHLCAFHAPVHSVCIAAHHHLTGRIEIGGNAHAIVTRGFGAYAQDRVILETQDRRHGTRANLTAAKHQLAAQPNRAESIVEAHRARSDIGRELAQRMTRCERHGTDARFDGALDCDGVGEDGWLCIDGGRQLVLRPLEAQPRESSTQHVVGFLEYRARRW
jgi:hypothetical protein